MSNSTNLTDWLADNPKMMGALWILSVGIAEVGVVTASGTAISGP